MRVNSHETGVQQRCVLCSCPPSCTHGRSGGAEGGGESGHLHSPGLLSTSFEEEKLARPSQPGPGSTPAPYLREGATGSPREAVIKAAAGFPCQGLDPVSTPSPLRWHQHHLSSRFQLRSSAHRRSGHPPQSPDNSSLPPSFPEGPPLSTPGILGRRKGHILGTTAGPIGPR